ncbi:hypothetical protein KSD_87810 [Ktedonobacter sp. SOSP1-85]|nr:hypothetical protein KSD_87810 [Ktedonobacter sp. SOSP1-85]
MQIVERTAGASVVVVVSVAGTVGVGKAEIAKKQADADCLQAETVEVDQGRQTVVKMGVKQVVAARHFFADSC